MKTLFQRFNPEVLISIYNEQSKYPSMVGSILKDLKYNYFIGDLTIDTVKHILYYTDCDSFDLEELEKLFES